MNPSPRSRPSGLPPELDRRFEAVILWSGTRAMSARTAQALTVLSEADVFVGWLAPASVQDLAQELKPAVGAAALLLADSEGSGAVAIDSSGTHRFGDPRRDLDLAALDEAGTTFAETLAGVGLAATAPLRPTGHPRVRIGLDRDTGPRTTWSGLKQLLLAHGIRGVSHLADLATEAAHRAGLDEPRVVVEGSTVEIALVDAGDVALEMLEELWRRGVDPQAVLVAVDGLSGVPHRPAPVIDPDVRESTVALVNGGRGSPRSGMVVLTGGTTRLHQLLADQLRRRRLRDLPVACTRGGWSLVMEGLDVEKERVHEAILALADGQVGTSGAPLAGDPSRHPWVVAAGIYDGSDSATHLLTGPAAFELGEPATGSRCGGSWICGLGSCTNTAVPRKAPSRACGSLRSPGPPRPSSEPGLRTRCGSVRRWYRPADDAIHDRGRDGGATWIRVAASAGGIVASAAQTRSAAPRPADGTVAGTEVVDRVAIYRSDPDSLPEPAPALDAVGQAATAGFDRLLAEHRQAWAGRWAGRRHRRRGRRRAAAGPSASRSST